MSVRRPVLILGALGVIAAGCSSKPVSQAVSQAASGIQLSPDPAYAASRIDVILEDPRADLSRCRFVWRRDGSVIPGADGPSLEPSQFHRGQTIAVEVSTGDSSAGAPQVFTDEIRVLNSPPKMMAVSLAMTVAAGTPVIQGSPTGLDSDADPLTYTWRWLKNDAPIEGGNSPTIEASRFQRGDLVRAEVMAHDGESESTPVQSDPFTVDNLPPQFSSKPAPPKEGDQVFRYQAVAVDPDHDPLRYELVRAPAGMTVEPEGLVVWNLPPRDARGVDAAVTLKVSDSKGGEAVQEFSIQFGASKR